MLVFRDVGANGLVSTNVKLAAPSGVARAAARFSNSLDARAAKFEAYS